MTPERMRVKIAEACGWERIEKPEFDDGIEEMRAMGTLRLKRQFWMDSLLPNCPGDLNAMIEAFGKLGRHWEISQVHDGYYCRIEFGPRNKDVTVGGLELLPVMGEAFLRTLGLWEEGDEP